MSRREYDAAVTIQKILRGVRIRLGALKQTRAVLLIQSLVRQKFSIRKRLISIDIYPNLHLFCILDLSIVKHQDILTVLSLQAGSILWNAHQKSKQ